MSAYLHTYISYTFSAHDEFMTYHCPNVHCMLVRTADDTSLALSPYLVPEGNGLIARSPAQSLRVISSSCQRLVGVLWPRAVAA